MKPLVASAGRSKWRTQIEFHYRHSKAATHRDRAIGGSRIHVDDMLGDPADRLETPLQPISLVAPDNDDAKIKGGGFLDHARQTVSRHKKSARITALTCWV